MRSEQSSILLLTQLDLSLDNLEVPVKRLDPLGCRISGGPEESVQQGRSGCFRYCEKRYPMVLEQDIYWTGVSRQGQRTGSDREVHVRGASQRAAYGSAAVVLVVFKPKPEAGTREVTKCTRFKCPAHAPSAPALETLHDQLGQTVRRPTVIQDDRSIFFGAVGRHLFGLGDDRLPRLGAVRGVRPPVPGKVVHMAVRTGN